MYLIVAFLLEWLYPVAFELTRWGATPGKRALGLKVVMDNGLPVTPAASLTRNLLRVADFLPFLYGFATVCLLTRRDFKRLGDLAAATLVVYQPPEVRKLQLAHFGWLVDDQSRGRQIAEALEVTAREQAHGGEAVQEREEVRHAQEISGQGGCRCHGQPIVHYDLQSQGALAGGGAPARQLECHGVEPFEQEGDDQVHGARDAPEG